MARGKGRGRRGMRRERGMSTGGLARLWEDVWDETSARKRYSRMQALRG